jgi:hypothetical protein
MTAASGVAESAEMLMASAERNGGIMLAELSQAELCTLRAESASLVCERTRRWWARLSPGEQRECGRLALELMVHRGFLRLPPRSAMQMPDLSQAFSPELAVIIAARTSPRPLAVCQVPGRDDLNWCHPRFFGITSPGRMLRVLMCEVLTEHPAGLHGQPTLGTILRYTLMTPERTAQMITSWAALIPEGQRRSGPPTLTLVAYGGQNTLTQESIGVRPRASAKSLSAFPAARSRATSPAHLGPPGAWVRCASGAGRGRFRRRGRRAGSGPWRRAWS